MIPSIVTIGSRPIGQWLFYKRMFPDCNIFAVIRILYDQMAKLRKRLNKINHPTVDVKNTIIDFLKVLRQFLGKATRYLNLSALKEMLYLRVNLHI